MNTRKVLGVAIAITLLGVGIYLCAYGAYDMWSWNEFVEYCTGGQNKYPGGCYLPEGGFPLNAAYAEKSFRMLTFIGSLFLVAGVVILVVLKKRY